MTPVWVPLRTALPHMPDNDLPLSVLVCTSCIRINRLPTVYGGAVMSALPCAWGAGLRRYSWAPQPLPWWFEQVGAPCMAQGSVLFCKSRVQQQQQQLLVLRCAVAWHTSCIGTHGSASSPPPQAAATGACLRGLPCGITCHCRTCRCWHPLSPHSPTYTLSSPVGCPPAAGLWEGQQLPSKETWGGGSGGRCMCLQCGVVLQGGGSTHQHIAACCPGELTYRARLGHAVISMCICWGWAAAL
jgi:hypothetical protein